jgi:hypothetical protein
MYKTNIKKYIDKIVKKKKFNQMIKKKKKKQRMWNLDRHEFLQYMYFLYI